MRIEDLKRQYLEVHPDGTWFDKSHTKYVWYPWRTVYGGKYFVEARGTDRSWSGTSDFRVCEIVEGERMSIRYVPFAVYRAREDARDHARKLAKESA